MSLNLILLISNTAVWAAVALGCGYRCVRFDYRVKHCVRLSMSGVTGVVPWIGIAPWFGLWGYQAHWLTVIAGGFIAWMMFATRHLYSSGVPPQISN